jgi:hypothetical protein
VTEKDCGTEVLVVEERDYEIEVLVVTETDYEIEVLLVTEMDCGTEALVVMERDFGLAASLVTEKDYGIAVAGVEEGESIAEAAATAESHKDCKVELARHYGWVIPNLKVEQVDHDTAEEVVVATAEVHELELEDMFGILGAALGVLEVLDVPGHSSLVVVVVVVGMDTQLGVVDIVVGEKVDLHSPRSHQSPPPFSDELYSESSF